MTAREMLRPRAAQAGDPSPGCPAPRGRPAGWRTTRPQAPAPPWPVWPARDAAWIAPDTLRTPPGGVAGVFRIGKPEQARSPDMDGTEGTRKGRRVMDWKLELVAIPVSDVDRAKAFYTEKAGFNADVDHRVNDEL